ncbi:MAG: glycosyltransferase [Syntrophomonadaceae bacterium]|nr:glycosyltransferase [Syntrophomonadaceae bacterium]MDD3022505.1 glycosyltransferase [Syntrophomonadaceae bacterium]
MKVLVTTGDFSHYLSPNFHYLLSELAKLVELTVWYDSGDIQEIIAQLDTPPDFVLINEFGETNSPKITGLATLSIPFAVALHDLHYQIEARKEAIIGANILHVFSLYRDSFYEWYPELGHKLHWLPHHANTDIFKDYGLPRAIDYLFMGAVHEGVYPLRYKILRKMKGRAGFVYHEHPGYRNYDDGDEALVGKNYALEINRAKIFLTCNSRYRYTLAKYFEILACKTLLLAPSSPELYDLGLIPGVHFVSINEDDFEEKAEFYLHHEKQRLEIACQGYDAVHRHHSTFRRAAQLVNIIENILGRSPF